MTPGRDRLIREAPDLLLAYVGAEQEGTRQSAGESLSTRTAPRFGVAVLALEMNVG